MLLLPFEADAVKNYGKNGNLPDKELVEEHQLAALLSATDRKEQSAP